MKKFMTFILAAIMTMSIAAPASAVSIDNCEAVNIDTIAEDTIIVADNSSKYNLFAYAQGHCNGDGTWRKFKTTNSSTGSSIPVYIRYNYNCYYYECLTIVNDSIKVYTWFNKNGVKQVDVYNNNTVYTFTSSPDTSKYTGSNYDIALGAWWGFYVWNYSGQTSNCFIMSVNSINIFDDSINNIKINTGKSASITATTTKSNNSQWSSTCTLFNYAQGHCNADGSWRSFYIPLKNNTFYFDMRYDSSVYKYELRYTISSGNTSVTACMWFDKNGMTQISVDQNGRNVANYYDTNSFKYNTYDSAIISLYKNCARLAYNQLKMGEYVHSVK